MYSTSELNPYVVRKKDSETENSEHLSEINEPTSSYQELRPHSYPPRTDHNPAYPHYQNACSYLEKGYVKVDRNCRDLKKGYEVDQNYLTTPFFNDSSKCDQNDAVFYLESGYEIYLPASQRQTEYVCPYHIGRLTPGPNGEFEEGPWIQV